MSTSRNLCSPGHNQDIFRCVGELDLAFGMFLFLWTFWSRVVAPCATSSSDKESTTSGAKTIRSDEQKKIKEKLEVLIKLEYLKTPTLAAGPTTQKSNSPDFPSTWQRSAFYTLLRPTNNASVWHSMVQATFCPMCLNLFVNFPSQRALWRLSLARCSRRDRQNLSKSWYVLTPILR